MAKVGSQKKPAARQARHLSLPVCCSSLSLLFEFLSVPRQAPVSKKPAAKLAAEAVKVVKERPATSTTQSGQAPKSSSASRKRPAATLETSAETAAKRPADTLETSAETTVKKRPAATLETSAETTRPPTLEDLQAGFFLCLYIYIKLSPLNPYIGLVNPSFCVETDLQEEDSGLEATWEACQAAEAAFQARKTKPEEPSQSPDKVSLSQETMVLGLYDPPITQSDFEQAMKDWPEEPDSYRDPSQEAEEEAPPGYLLVWDLLSPLQKWIIKQNPRVRDGLQPCGRPVSNSKSK